jgi:hypothetical protein
MAHPHPPRRSLGSSNVLAVLEELGYARDAIEPKGRTLARIYGEYTS